jgi:hypothetical protein
MAHDILTATIYADPLDKPFDKLTLSEWEEIRSKAIEEMAEAILMTCDVSEYPDGDFGTLYLLRQGKKLLGSFYKKVLSDGTDDWVAQTTFDHKQTFYSSTEGGAKFCLAWAWVQDNFLID